MEDSPDVDTIIVPVGVGSDVCGKAIAARGIHPPVEVILLVEAIGARSAQAPAYSITLRRLMKSLRSKSMVLKNDNKSVEFHRTDVYTFLIPWAL